MQFKPEKTLVFSYEPDRHLPTNLTLKNPTSSNIYYKFKVSTSHKFSIKPSNIGLLKPGEETVIQIVIHRDIVGRAGEQKVQIIYGPNYEESTYFELLVENGSRSDKLNLTMMINEKENRIKYLEDEVSTYRAQPIVGERGGERGKGKEGGVLAMVAVVVVGLLLGYFSPLSVFG